MADVETLLAIMAAEAPVRIKKSNYPEPFATRMEGRQKRPLGDLFGLTNFGVNLTTLAPGAVSALQHRHHVQDEFVYVVSGEIWLIAGQAEQLLLPGMCAGFKAGGESHHLENRSSEPATYLEIGDRSPGDTADYPHDDLVAVAGPAGWHFTHKDGSVY